MLLLHGNSSDIYRTRLLENTLLALHSILLLTLGLENTVRLPRQKELSLSGLKHEP